MAVTGPEKEKTDAFLTEYLALARKYGVHINSCSCCESPWLAAVDDYDPNLEKHERHLRYGVDGGQ